MLISVARDDPAPTQPDAGDDSLFQQRIHRQPSNAQSEGDLGDGHSIAWPLFERIDWASAIGILKRIGQKLFFLGAVHNCLAFRANTSDESSCAKQAQKWKRKPT